MSEWDFLWGLEGQELMDAMSSGGTYDDWAYIERMERKQYGFDADDYYDDDYYDEPSAKKNTMVFIDAENVSSTHAASIENEIWDIGNVAEVRYYAMLCKKTRQQLIGNLPLRSTATNQFLWQGNEKRTR